MWSWRGVCLGVGVGVGLAWLELRRRWAHAALCETYSLDPRAGFVLPVARALPPPFDEWEQIAIQLPALNRSGRLRAAVDGASAVPQSTTAALSPAEQRRAYVLFASVAHSYVNGSSVPWDKLGEAVAATEPADEAATPELPSQLAVPFRAVCEALQVPCVFIATGTDLWNSSPRWCWQRATDPCNFRQAISMSGTRSENGFHATPFAIQQVLTPLLPSLLRMPTLVEERRWWQLTRLLRRTGRALRRVRQLLEDIPAGVDPDEFYDIYRPLLGGWAGRGLILKGATAADDKLVECKGPSAGQTAALILLDLVLGVRHRHETAGFQQEMRHEYLPGPHAQLLEDMESLLAQHGSARDAASLPEAPEALRAAHTEALEALAGMRACHLGIASRYLRRTGTGTGGSDFRSMLGEAVKSTRASVVGAA